MAKLNELVESDDELPDFSTILARIQNSTQRQSSSSIKDVHTSTASLPRSKITLDSNKSLPKHSCEIYEQNSLETCHVDPSLIKTLPDQVVVASKKGPLRRSNPIVHSPKRDGRSLTGRTKYAPISNSSLDYEDMLSDHMSEFIVSDAESDESSEVSLPSHAWTFRNDRAPARPRKKVSSKKELIGRTHCHSRIIHSGAVQDEHGSIFQDTGSILKFSPPRLKSPSRSPPPNWPATPPTSPSKSKLLSPSKRFRIPPSPHRPSIDAFWSQEVINDWNDQHSPQKTPKSTHPRRPGDSREHDEDYLSPCETGRRSPSKSATKRDKKATERRKTFNEKKYALAASFLEELDRTIVNGQIMALAESTGGVHLIWSNKLQSTAGRANWKRETVRTKNADKTYSPPAYRHHASIELAEKVIDAEDRLINVIAHEYCHLLNFMISNVKDRPHGKEFKMWARKCSAAFAHRGINVTTKHSYEIEYKYVWACTQCATEYRRHSKSIDPARHSCGKCKEKLVQIKPVPRKEGHGLSEYQKFIKEHFTRLKKEQPAMGMGEVMTVLGREFREMKEKQNKEVTVVEEKTVEIGESEIENDSGLESVVRKMDFLNLESR